MKKFYRFGATVFAVMAGLAAVGAGALIVATAVVIGGLLALAGKLAINGMGVTNADAPQDEDLGFEEKATA
ncbi:MAG: hypothetical protein P8P56_04215 [Yoonia sp.]|nr:hypothetical protein [Yoonia sp.]